jgi:hypothetical protein
MARNWRDAHLQSGCATDDLRAHHD